MVKIKRIIALCLFMILFSGMAAATGTGEEHVPPVREIPIMESLKVEIPAGCQMTSELMNRYHNLLSELRDAESDGDNERIEAIKNEMMEFKEEAARQKENCTKLTTENLKESPVGVKLTRIYIGNLSSASSASGVNASSASEANAASGSDIKDYYKERIEEITSSDDIDEQIKGLKELRNEIDGLIRKLIESKNDIQTEEVEDIVTEIKVKPGEINADEIQVKTTEKRILTDLNEKQISIEPREDNVLIKEESIEVTAEEVSLKNDTLSVGNSEVKIAPSEVIDKLQVNPNGIELKEEESGAVYKVKTDEERKFLGVIPMNIEKEITVDANNNDFMSEQKPWFTFMTTE